MVQDTGNKLITALEKQTEKIIYFCSAENISPNLAVHEIRKSYKRLRALLQFFAECNPSVADNFTKEIKAAGKVLSPIRESFVNIQFFEKITTGSNLISERKIKQVKDLLSEKNRVLIDDEFTGTEVIPGIIQFVKQLQLQINILRTSCPSVLQLKTQLSLTFAEGYEIYQNLEPDFSPVNMHELRKALKQLWYQLDFVKFKHPRYFRLKSYHLNKITEQLGIDHDMYVFLEDLKAGEFHFSDDEMIILDNQVQHQRELNMVKLLPRLKQFFSEPPEIFDRRLDKIFKIN
jgi:CHAD domain-containing protein